ncbi:MAG: hypothetical protein HYS23_14680 [Geobacter sp.]|nr:hypothetical protein [Geobacter sp.]
MKRLIIMLMAIGMLTGCSELKIIGRTAFKELREEAVSAEWITYNQVEDDSLYQEKLPSPVMKNRKPPVLIGLDKMAKNKPVRKGLWEKH